MIYYRPLVQHGPARPDGALELAAGPLWFTHAEALSRDGAQIVPAAQIPADWLERLTAPRLPLAGLRFDAPQVMGILNVTPDSFSDGGRLSTLDAVLAQGRQMAEAGAHMLDIGGESTRPGAAYVTVDEEIARTRPAFEALRSAVPLPLSVDTRKAPVAQAALGAGAALVNDVSGLTHDPAMAEVCADTPVCVMHAQGDPDRMQEDPRYDNVVLDVYDWLEARLTTLAGQGIPRGQVLVDPGIGFGKTLDHNLALLQNLSLFHGLGCAILLGVSRKRFIGTIGEAPEATDRVPGSLAVALAGVAQGAQVLRVHDVAETVQALRLWAAARG